MDKEQLEKQYIEFSFGQIEQTVGIAGLALEKGLSEQ